MGWVVSLGGNANRVFLESYSRQEAREWNTLVTGEGPELATGGREVGHAAEQKHDDEDGSHD